MVNKFISSPMRSFNYVGISVVCLLSAILSCTSPSYAQEVPKPPIEVPKDAPTDTTNTSQKDTITGIVSDEKGSALPGVSVMVKGKPNTGTTTDANGRYKATVDARTVLVFSYTGYGSREERVGGRTKLDVSLQAAQENLEEVVVVGYGSVKKRDLTGSVAQVKASEINAFPTSNAVQSLSGRASGVQVYQGSGAPGPAMSVRIRGANSMLGSNEPLYVVDGFPLSGSNPTILNNADIESMEILKDASATAIYGSRGANGVVIITTKQGGVEGSGGQTQVDFEANYGVQQLRKKLDLMNGSEYATFYNLRATNDGLEPHFTPEEINSMPSFDWQDFIFRSAPIKSTSLNISGGNERTQFSVGGSVLDQEGIIKGSDYSRYSFRSNVQHQISDKLTVDANATLSRLITGRKDSNGGARGNSLISSILGAPPGVEAYDSNGGYSILANAFDIAAPDIVNPLNWINEETNKTEANLILANAAITYRPIQDLNLKLLAGIENRDDRENQYRSTKFQGSTGTASVTSNNEQSMLVEATANYNKIWNDRHNFSVLAGVTYQNFSNSFVTGSGQGFVSDVSEWNYLEGALVPSPPKSGYNKSVLVSYLTRVNYTLDDKYLFTATFRADGSSRYQDGYRWGYFPSGAFAWRMSNENFMKEADWISDLKLRVSWGKTGTQIEDFYATYNPLMAGYTIFGEDLSLGFAPGTVLPQNLKWETTEQFDAGFDLGISDNRFVFTADYYMKNTKDLLNSIPLPTSMGYLNTIQNVGQIRNSGVEFGLNAKIFKGDFQWNVNGNIAFNRSKVLKLYGGNDILGDDVSAIAVSDSRTILREGLQRGVFYGYREDGYDESGQIMYQDLNNDGTISPDDRTIIGNPNPDFIYGLNSSMSYKNFDFTFFFQGMVGNDLFNASAIGSTIDYGSGLNMVREVLEDHWTPENPNAKYPVISNTVNARVSDRWIEDGSFLRLKNIQLAYNLPVGKLNIAWLKRLQVYASGQNLLTFTSYSWWDPEMPTNGSDYLSYPIAKTYTFGIKAGF